MIRFVTKLLTLSSSTPSGDETETIARELTKMLGENEYLSHTVTSLVQTSKGYSRAPTLLVTLTYREVTK